MTNVSFKLNPQPEPPGIKIIHKLAHKLGKTKLIGSALGTLAIVAIGGMTLANGSPQNYVFSTRSVAVTLKPKLLPGPFTSTVPSNSLKTTAFTQSYSGASDAKTTTGILVSGIKASGSIMMSISSCRKSVTLDSATIITWNQTGKTFKLGQATPLTINPGESKAIPIVATDFGADYNAPDGQTWHSSDGCVSSSGLRPGTTYNGLKTTGNIAIIGSETYKITKTISKPAVGSEANTMVAGAEIEISVIMATPADLLAAIKTAHPTADHTNWKPTSATISGNNIDIAGQGDAVAAAVSTAAIKSYLMKNNLACNKIHGYLSSVTTIDKFNIIGKPDCTDKQFSNVVYSVKITDTDF